jgi:ubiquitin carboxyl-terminal hydrolase 36/42
LQPSFNLSISHVFIRCKKPVVAEKRFSVHEAPMVLTVHLKRFTPMGRKIGNHVDYEERLTLKPYMSEGQHGPTYSLYGVICHAGGGPNSGHYFAYVKSRSGKWCEMNDESVTPNVSTPVNLKNAYILFYLRDKGQGLDAAVNATPQANGGGIVAGMKKRRVREEDEDAGVKVTKPFIGPRMPSPVAAERSKATPLKVDPQADVVRKKIEAARSGNSKALTTLAAEYASDSDGEEATKPPPSPPHLSSLPPSSPPPTTPAATSSTAVSSPVTSTTAASSPVTVVPATNFYGGTPSNPHKRKHSESFGHFKDRDRAPKRSPLGASLNPYGNHRLGTAVTYGKHGKRGKGMPRGI